jgi:hypothetical protein
MYQIKKILASMKNKRCQHSLPPPFPPFLFLLLFYVTMVWHICVNN